MSWAGKVTCAVAAFGGLVWNDVRLAMLQAPQPQGLVDIGKVAFFVTPDGGAQWLLAPVITASLLPSAAINMPLAALDEVELPRLLHAPPVFMDRFESLDEARLWAVSDGWTNGAWTANDWRRRQIQTSADGLSIVLSANQQGADQPFASGELQSRELFRYGYFEARLRMPRGSGLVGGVFTFARPDGRESWDEIDIEILGRDTRRLELTYFSAGRETKHVITLPFDAADDYHTYAFDWQPTYIRWYVDGQLVHEARGPLVEAMTREQRFIVNLWNSEQLAAWVGPLDAAGGPWTLSLACVAHAEVYIGAPLCAEAPPIQRMSEQAPPPAG